MNDGDFAQREISADKPREPLIGFTLQHQKKRTEDLITLIERLENKIKPVLRLEPSAEIKDENKAKTPTTILAESINSNTRIIDTAIAKISRLIDLCEL